ARSRRSAVSGGPWKPPYTGVISRPAASRTAAGNRRGEGRSRLPCTSAPGPPASNRRFSRRTCRTVIRRAAATWAFVSRPPHSAFNSPARCSSFRLNVKVSIEGGPFHGAVRGGHFHVAAAQHRRRLDDARVTTYCRGVALLHRLVGLGLVVGL